MKTMTVGKFKAEFSQVSARVAEGHSVAIAYGRKHVPVAVMGPYNPKRRERKLGVLAGRVSYAWMGDGKITDEDLLQA